MSACSTRSAIWEVLKTLPGSGCFEKAPPSVGNPDGLHGQVGAATDRHLTKLAVLTGPGERVVEQAFKFKEGRLQSEDIPMAGAGFQITRSADEDPARVPADPAKPCLVFTTSKHGASVSVPDKRGDINSSAGSADIDGPPQALPCQEATDPGKKPPPPPGKKPPPPGPKPVPDPTPEPVPDPTPQDPTPQAAPPCDKAELSKRVDACIAQAKQDAIDCTLAAANPLGWAGVGSGLNYIECMDQLKARLMDCDQHAKADTNCQDGKDNGGSPSPGALISAAGLPTDPKSPTATA